MSGNINGQRPPLPAGWEWSTLGELCEIVGGITVDAKRQDDDLVEVPYLRVANVQRGALDLSVVKKIRVSSQQAQRLQLRPNDVLLNEGGDKDKVGRGWVWSGEIESCIHQNHIFRARPLVDGMDGRWISAYANELGRSYLFEQTKQTTNLASIGLSKIRNLPIPVAPLGEQHRIWRKVEQLFGEIETGEQELRNAREGLETYRRAVLMAAVTGELTKDWRKKDTQNEDGTDLLAHILKERHAAWIRAEITRMKARGTSPKNDAWRTKYPSVAEPNLEALHELPPGWVWASLDQLSYDSSYGTSVKCTPSAHGQAVLRIPNVRANRISLDDIKYATDALELSADDLLSPGDLLIIRTNGSENLIGQGAVVHEPLAQPAYFASYLIRFRLVPVPILWQWISYIWPSGVIRRQIKQVAATSAGQYNVSQSNLIKFVLPLPGIEEMSRILSIVTVAMDVAQDSDLAGFQQTSDTLRQAILAAAFAGKLVPRDPNDEPAAELLDRLRASKVAMAAIRRTKPSKFQKAAE
jgi:type I restriction enzyme, S subunit